MLPPVLDVVQRFRSRLRLWQFAAGAMQGGFAAALALAVWLLVERFAAVALLTAMPAWIVAALVLLVAVAVGGWRAARFQADDAFLVAHLEERLGTNGLLLVASEGVVLDLRFQAALARQLQRVPSILPRMRWQGSLLRWLFAAGMLAMVLSLPVTQARQPAVEALLAATQQLAQEVEQLAETAAVPDERVAELRRAVNDLQQRTAAGGSGLWRDVDSVRERIAREQQLAAATDAPSAMGLAAGDGKQGRGRSGEASAPSVQDIADAMTKLGALRPAALQELKRGLPQLTPPEQRAVADAIQADGSVDAAVLPSNESARKALATAVAKVAEVLAKDPVALAEMAEGLSPLARQQMEDVLQELAQSFAAARDPDAQNQGAQNPDAQDPAASPTLADGDSAALRAEVAKAAVEMAEAGALDKLPEGLRDAMLKAGMSALEGLDPQALLALLPDDLSQLLAMGESVAEVMKSMAGGSEAAGGSVPDIQLSPEMQKRMAALAKGLMAKMPALANAALDRQQPGSKPVAGQQPGSQQGSQPGSEPAGAGALAASDGPSGAGDSRDGGGHAALRLTEDTQGGVGATEVVLPERVHQDLPTEWQPLAVEKAAPEVGVARSAGAGRAGASGSGGATWQLRLMPRHRDVVRRFFAEKNK